MAFVRKHSQLLSIVLGFLLSEVSPDSITQEVLHTIGLFLSIHFEKVGIGAILVCLIHLLRKQ